MHITQDKNNLLLKRREIEASIDKSGAPSNAEVTKLISEHFKKGEECIVINKIKLTFGTKQALIIAKVYENEEAKNKIETVSRKQKKKIAEEAKKTAETKQ